MKKIELICFGDLKFKELIELEKGYLKKLKYFADIKKTVLKDLKIKNEKQKREEEGKIIAGLIKKSDYIIALDEKGKGFSSKEFSIWLSDKVSYFQGKIVFLIGGHYGLSSSLDKYINQKISFSKMTFPHDLFRIIFFEQLYRSFTIEKGITYHR